MWLNRQALVWMPARMVFDSRKPRSLRIRIRNSRSPCRGRHELWFEGADFVVDALKLAGGNLVPERVEHSAVARAVKVLACEISRAILFGGRACAWTADAAESGRDTAGAGEPACPRLGSGGLSAPQLTAALDAAAFSRSSGTLLAPASSRHPLQLRQFRSGRLREDKRARNCA